MLMSASLKAHDMASPLDEQIATLLESLEKDKDLQRTLLTGTNEVAIQVIRESIASTTTLLSSLLAAKNPAAASPPTTQGKDQLPAPALVTAPVFARSSLAPCSFYLAPPVFLPPCSVLSNLLCASGRRVCARTRLRGWASEIVVLAKELSLRVRVCVLSVSVCV